MSSPLFAQSAPPAEDTRSFIFLLNGTEHTITRSGPPCPPSCLQPMTAAPRVETLGEVEVIAFLQGPFSAGLGLVVDVRAPALFSAGSVPGAVNVPAVTFHPDNPYRADLLSALGVTAAGTAPDFTDALTLLVLGSGPDDALAGETLGHLIAAGYPPEKVKYYRGGVSTWQVLGLDVSEGR